jgi:hypothetical protein
MRIVEPWIVNGREIAHLDPSKPTSPTEFDGDDLWPTILWCVIAVCAAVICVAFFDFWVLK